MPSGVRYSPHCALETQGEPTARRQVCCAEQPRDVSQSDPFGRPGPTGSSHAASSAPLWHVFRRAAACTELVRQWPPSTPGAHSASVVQDAQQSNVDGLQAKLPQLLGGWTAAWVVSSGARHAPAPSQLVYHRDTVAPEQLPPTLQWLVSLTGTIRSATQTDPLGTSAVMEKPSHAYRVPAHAYAVVTVRHVPEHAKVVAPHSRSGSLLVLTGPQWPIPAEEDASQRWQTSPVQSVSQQTPSTQRPVPQRPPTPSHASPRPFFASQRMPSVQ